MNINEFEALVGQHGGTAETYDQGHDDFLMSHPHASGGACVAVCVRWLGCRKLGQDFWSRFRGPSEHDL